MKLLRPGELTQEEYEQYRREEDERYASLDLTDERLKEYVRLYFKFYRETLEKHFPTLAPHIARYANAAYDTYILRLGEHGIVMGHRPAQGPEPSITVMRPEDFDPPLTSINVVDVMDRWGTRDFGFASFKVEYYDAEQAEVDGVRQAFDDVRRVFWAVHQPDQLRQICMELLKAEGFALEEVNQDDSTGEQVDVLGDLLMDEPARYRRMERWAFKIYHETERVTPTTIQAAEAYISENANDLDVLCLITSGDLTSIGNYIASQHNRIRIWDRGLLDVLMTKHLGIVAPHFPSYADAVKVVEGEWALTGSEQPAPSRLEEFRQWLQACPPGQASFHTYEQLGKDIWEYLFTPDALGPGRAQVTTSDGTQRRDVLFPNKRTRQFWQRVFQKHEADVIIVDFKNYKDPVEPGVLNDVVQYASKALGWFIVVVSRAGADATFLEAQVRRYKDTNPGVVVLVVSDSQMLEMIRRKESGEAAEDVLDDIYEEFLLRC